jgi:hypothetical protein
MSVAISITNSVSWLEVASHTVRLADGMMSDGIKNGNMLTPAVEMMPRMPIALVTKARPARRPAVNIKVASGPMMASAGANIIHSLPPQPDPNLWITWDVTWRPPERGFYVLRVRATSANGRKQDFPGVIAVEVS